MASLAKGFHDERYRQLIDQLVVARKAAGLSQRQLADKLSNHQQFVSRYEIGERRLDVVEFADIARVIGLDPARMVNSISPDAT